MDAYIQLKIAMLCMQAQNCFGIYNPEWMRPLHELLMVCDAMEVECEELKQAATAATDALQRLKHAMKNTATKVRLQNLRTGLEPQVPLHVDDEAAVLEARQPLDVVDVVHDEVELLPGVCGP